MTFFDDNPSNPSDPGLPAQPLAEAAVEQPSPLSPPVSLPGDPISYAAAVPTAALPSRPVLPEDLRISWSWPHFLVFLLFGAVSQITIGVLLIIYYSGYRHFTQKQLQRIMESNPQVLVTINVLWFALIILFLYVTLSVLRDAPFWRSLGWKKLNPNPLAGNGKPWMYFLSGSGLALFVAMASSRVHTPDHLPIQDMFKDPDAALMFTAMAVLVAPLVEETVFRGYLYPLLASKFSSLAGSFGLAPGQALRFGTAAGIVVTGFLFGLMHGAQLGWTWSIVALLILVGVVFTFARAITGTVLASFLLHLGYNSMLAAASLISTKGFTHIPRGH